MMKVGIIIQARMGSERLPGKVLQQIGGRAILELLTDRIKVCNLPIVVATTTNTTDDVLEKKMKLLNIPCFRGSEDDVLSRYYECALLNKLDVIIRLTADNPLVDTTLINTMVSEYLNANDEDLYMSSKGYPLGTSLEIFSLKSLSDAFFNATHPKAREHVTPYIVNKPETKKKYISYKSDKSNYRLTIDTTEDFEVVKQLIEKYNAEHLSIDALIAVLDEHPELVKMNAAIHQKKWNE